MSPADHSAENKLSIYILKSKFIKIGIINRKTAIKK